MICDKCNREMYRNGATYSWNCFSCDRIIIDNDENKKRIIKELLKDVPDENKKRCPKCGYHTMRDRYSYWDCLNCGRREKGSRHYAKEFSNIIENIPIIGKPISNFINFIVAILAYWMFCLILVGVFYLIKTIIKSFFGIYSY